MWMFFHNCAMQVQRWANEVTRVKKNFADLATKTSSRLVNWLLCCVNLIGPV